MKKIYYLYIELVFTVLGFYFENIFIAVSFPVFLIAIAEIKKIKEHLFIKKFWSKKFEENKKMLKDRYIENGVNRNNTYIKYFIYGEAKLKENLINIYNDYINYNLQRYYLGEAYDFSFTKDDKYSEEFDVILEIHHNICDLIQYELNIDFELLIIKINSTNDFLILNENYKYKKIVDLVGIFKQVKDEIKKYNNSVSSNLLVVSGKAGIGKTNLVFNEIDNRFKFSKYNYIVICRNIKNKSDLNHTDNNYSLTLKKIIEILSKNGGVLILDGLNESKYYNDNIYECNEAIRKLKENKNLKIIITIRDEYIETLEGSLIKNRLKLGGISVPNVAKFLDDNNIEKKYYLETILENPLVFSLFVEVYTSDSEKIFIGVLEEYLKNIFNKIKYRLLNDEIHRSSFHMNLYKAILEELIFPKVVNELENRNLTSTELLGKILYFMLDEGIVEKTQNYYTITFDLLRSYIELNMLIKNNELIKINYFEDILKYTENTDIRKLNLDTSNEFEIFKLYLENAIYTNNLIDYKYVFEKFEKFYQKYTLVEEYNSVSKMEYSDIFNLMFILQDKDETIKQYLRKDIVNIGNTERDIKYLSIINKYNLMENNDYTDEDYNDINIIQYILKKNELSEFELLIMLLCLMSSNRKIRDNVSVKIFNIIGNIDKLNDIKEYMYKMHDIYLWQRMFEVFKYAIYEGKIKDLNIIKEIYDFYIEYKELWCFSIEKSYLEICNITNMEFYSSNAISGSYEKNILLNSKDTDYEALSSLNRDVASSIGMNDKRSYGDWGRYVVAKYLDNFILNRVTVEEINKQYNEQISINEQNAIDKYKKNHKFHIIFDEKELLQEELMQKSN